MSNEQMLAKFQAMIRSAQGIEVPTRVVSDVPMDNFVTYRAGTTRFGTYLFGGDEPVLAQIRIPAADNGGSNIRLLRMSGRFQPVFEKDEAGNRTENMRSVDFIVEMALGLIGEKISIVDGDGKEHLLPGYGVSDEAADANFAAWRERDGKPLTHRIETQTWLRDADQAELDKVMGFANQLVAKYGFRFEDQPERFNPDTNSRQRTNEEWVVLPPGVERDDNGEADWAGRGAPVTAFQLTAPRPRAGEAGAARRANYTDLAKGTWEAMEAFTIALSPQVDDETRRRNRRHRYRLTGCRPATDRNGQPTLYYNQANLAMVNVGGAEYSFTVADEIPTVDSLLERKAALLASLAPKAAVEPVPADEQQLLNEVETLKF